MSPCSPLQPENPTYIEMLQRMSRIGISPGYSVVPSNQITYEQQSQVQGKQRGGERKKKLSKFLCKKVIFQC